MTSELFRVRRRSEAVKQLKQAFAREDNLIVVHYSCESFHKHDDGRSLRVASIAVKFIQTGEIRNFSILHHAEKLKANLSVDTDYQRAETSLLEDFFAFVGKHQGYTWAHWNMRNINFGFQALEHRFRVLGGEPVILDAARKIDFSELLKRIYGRRYADKPVLVNLCEMNDIKSDFFLPGAIEAEMFEQGEFRKLHQSTQKKADFIAYIAELAAENRLKTKASWIERYGLHPKIIVDLIHDSWVARLLAVAAAIAGIVGLSITIWGGNGGAP